MSSDSEESVHDENIAKLIPNAINYKTRQVEVDLDSNILDVSSVDGLKCEWSGKSSDDCESISFNFKFDWEEIPGQKVEDLVGQITIDYSGYPSKCNLEPYGQLHLDVDLNNENKVIEEYLEGPFRYAVDCIMSYSLCLTRSPIIKTDDVVPTKNDAVLIFKGKSKLDVNKDYLSKYSVYFHELFSDKKNANVTEFAIKDTGITEFRLLLNAILLDVKSLDIVTEPPNKKPRVLTPQWGLNYKDGPSTRQHYGNSSRHYEEQVREKEEREKNVETVLKLADRFKVPIVVAKIEQYYKKSDFGIGHLLVLADKHKMSSLMEKCFRRLNTAEKYGQLARCDLSKFSDELKLKLFDHLMEIY